MTREAQILEFARKTAEETIAALRWEDRKRQPFGFRPWTPTPEEIALIAASAATAAVLAAEKVK